MVRVMASGVFDILHSGHLFYLREAAGLGDELHVVVATDATVRKLKHEPILNENMRVELVGELRMVTRALLGGTGDRLEVVRQIKPDIICLGWDQAVDEVNLREQLLEAGINCRVVRLGHTRNDLDSTRRIIQKIVDWHALKKKLEKEEGC